MAFIFQIFKFFSFFVNNVDSFVIGWEKVEILAFSIDRNLPIEIDPMTNNGLNNGMRVWNTFVCTSAERNQVILYVYI